MIGNSPCPKLYIPGSQTMAQEPFDKAVKGAGQASNSVHGCLAFTWPTPHGPPDNLIPLTSSVHAVAGIHSIIIVIIIHLHAR